MEQGPRFTEQARANMLNQSKATLNDSAIMIANLILMGPTDLRPALDSVDRPVLFVASSLDWAVAAAKEVREGWPDVHVDVIDETSHALFVDKPEEFNRVLEEFLATLPEKKNTKMER